jgi:hypothetical protein
MFDLFGNTTTDPNASSSNSFLSSLGGFANQVAPLVTAVKGLTTGGTPVVPPAASSLTTTLGGISMQTLLIFGGIAVAILGAIFVLPKLFAGKKN